MSAADPFGLVGQVLDGQFRVDGLVGEGGFSAVYRGHHQGLNEPIAIKCLKLPTSLGTALVDSFVQRFRDESRILYRLSQGNLHIVRSIAAGTTQAPATGALVPYMVLEWLEGATLQSDFSARRARGERGRSLDEVAQLFAAAADGLASAHGQGVVHRDLNPGNLFVAKTQQGSKMKVLDFGVAKLMHQGALDMGPRAQTLGQIKIFAPAYGAPEQFDDRIGAVSAASDVYSFALIVLEALRDKTVVEATNLGEFAQRTTDPTQRPTPRSLGLEVPDEVERAFARATTLNPADRFQSVGDFWQSLTIALKLATEHKYEQAARETPPLAMPLAPGATTMGSPGAGPLAPKGAAIGGKNLARTVPLGENTPGLPRDFPRPGPAGAIGGSAAPRAGGWRKATAIGLPAPAGASPEAAPPASPASPASPAPQGAGRGGALPMSPRILTPPPRRVSSRPPAPGHNAALPLVPPAPAAPFSPPAARAEAHDGSNARSASPPTARFPSAPAVEDEGQGAPDAQAAPNDDSAGSGGDDDDRDEATMVHAPSNDILRTLAEHDAQAAQDDPRPGASEAPNAPAKSDTERPSPVTRDADSSGSTMVMAPGVVAPPAADAPSAPGSAPQVAPFGPGAPGALGSTVAMMPPMPREGFGFTPPHDPMGQGTTQGDAQLSPPAPPQAPPPQAPPPSEPQFAAAAPVQGGAPYGGPPFGAPMPAQGGAPLGQPSMGQPSAAPSFAQPATPQARSLPIVPIGIGLAVLALTGIGLGGYALSARRAQANGNQGTVPDSSEAASLTPVPVSAPEPAEPAPSAEPAVAPEDDAAAVEVEAPDASVETVTEDASAALAASASAPAAPTSSPAPTTPAFKPPAFVATAAPAPTKPAVDPNAFNEAAARARLSQANGVLAFCKKPGGVTGAGKASVTFGPDGTVSNVSLNPPYAGTKEGACITSQFRRAKISAFVGAPQTVRHSFEVPK